MDFSPEHLWQSMGLFAKLIVVVMLLMSLASLVVLFERIAVFSRSGSESLAFARSMAKVLGEGDANAALNADLPKQAGHLGLHSELHVALGRGGIARVERAASHEHA